MSYKFYDNWGVRKWRRHFDASIIVKVSLAIPRKNVRNAVIRAIERGYLPTQRGAAAQWYELIRMHFDLPGIVFSEQGGGAYWRGGVSTYGLPKEVHGLMHEWWTADRVAWRLDFANMDAVEQQKRSYMNNYHAKEKEPDWSGGDDGYAFASVLTDKARSNFEPVGAAMVALPEYQAKAQLALQAIRDGLIVDMDLNPKPQATAEIVPLWAHVSVADPELSRPGIVEEADEAA